MNSLPDELMSDNMGGDSGADIDLLLQFQCMGTSDRDVLVAEFQRLLGPTTLRPETCAFFLEMNNWYVPCFNCSPHHNQISVSYNLQEFAAGDLLLFRLRFAT